MYQNMKLYSLVIIIFLQNLSVIATLFSKDPDIDRNVTEMIISKGFPVEEYEVKTEDGYILGLQRIPHGRQQHKTSNCKREVVFLQHGLAVNAKSWVSDFPDQSLAYALADAGHDVWLGNTRGTTYSKKHIKLTPDMKEFWEFSYDEMATYDIPAMIDFVLNKTKKGQLVYIGHSQGTTVMFALLSQSQEYNKKVKLFIAQAPVTTLHHLSGPLGYIYPFINQKVLEFILKLLRIYNVAPPPLLQTYLKTGACDREIKFICEVAYGGLGFDPWQLNKTRLSVYSTLLFSGVCSQNLLHFLQVKKANKFQKYDFGPLENMKHYNQATPPVYDITKITTPIVLMWGRNDDGAKFEDVHEIEQQLPSLVLNYPIPYESFNHLDFIWAIDGYKLSHVKVLELLC